MTNLLLSESSASPAHSARSCFLVLCWLLIGVLSFAQMEMATVSGTIMDHSGAAIANVQVQVTNSDTDITATTSTNGSGIYVLPSLKPGRYRIVVTKIGFKQVVVTDVILNVQDVVSRNFNLEVGAISESITVTADQLNVNTTDATVSTVVDRQFAENLPLNGRSFQTLLYLTPGVNLNVGSGQSNGYATGQFVVNGQRASSNYWMVDGVSANIGITSFFTPGNGLSGSLGSFNVLGGTNSLVSVDALQEFRIQTSTYAPEFGRTPGGQISVATRSGSNSFHGTAFDYLRNDALDASDWFNGFNNNPPLSKAKEKQNDFGGTLSGPIKQSKTFFFFSYEGLRLRLPRTELTTAPDLAVRQSAIAAVRPFLDAFPIPYPGAADVGPGYAPFNASFSDPASIDAYSLRVDHALTKGIVLFARYNYSPSEKSERGNFASLNTITAVRNTTQTGTVGATWTPRSTMVDDFRFNYSSSGGTTSNTIDSFGGGVPPPVASQLPAPFTLQDSNFEYLFFFGSNMGLSAGKNAGNKQHQYNVVDTLSVQKGSHSLKFGFDYRRLSPEYQGRVYSQAAFYFSDLATAASGNVDLSSVQSLVHSVLLSRNFSSFAQDTWKIVPRLTLTYGLRWDIDFTPITEVGPPIAAVSGFSLQDFSQLALAPSGTPIYKTPYGSFAPRFGAAYQISNGPKWGAVVRGGLGVFYDLASSEVGNYNSVYPFLGESDVFGGVFPLPASVAAPPAITPPNSTHGTLVGYDPKLELPYTLQWSLSVEQAFGGAQTLSASYLGSAGRRLLATESISQPNPQFGSATLIANAGKSSYNSLQIQFQRRLSQGMQAMASYTWSHSIDDGSYGTYTDGNFLNLSSNRASSDFDVRHSFSTALTYDIPGPKGNAILNAILSKWSVQNIIQARTAPPVDILDQRFFSLSTTKLSVQIRPDINPAQPSFYLYGSQYPGGKAINEQAFIDPPVDPVTGNPTRQGNLHRNALRGFPVVQWDFATHREFPLGEKLKLQFRAELFNILNHPNFGAPNNDFGVGDPYFGLSTQMLGRSIRGVGGNGGFDPLYQIGGPRSAQVALKLVF